MENTASALRVNHILRGTDYTYHIEKVLGQGSFGITYLASTKVKISGALGNIETEIKVAVKEFFMKEFSSRKDDGTVTEMTDGSLVRNYAGKFRKEAENLAKLSHPNIVNVLEVFEANNTCYYAMQYISGGSLDAYVKQKGGLPESEAIECIRQIGEAVQYMHAHRMLHLDLKPSNVMRSEDGKKMVLIDFGLSKQYESNGNPESSTTIGLGTPGYAPIEQSSIDRDKDFAPTLDMYALGATFFKLLTGQTPPVASAVLDEGLPIDELKAKGVSEGSIRAIEMAMEPRKSKRIPDVNSFLFMLSASDVRGEEETVVDNRGSKPDHEPEPEPLPHSKPSFPVWLKWGLAIVAAVVLVIIGIRSLINPKPINPDELVTPSDSVAVVVPQVTEIPETATSTSSVAAVIALKSISLNKTTIELEEGQSATLSVKYTPSDATDKTTSWSSTDPKTASVNNKGKVTAVKSGSVAIIASCSGIEAYCNVTVKQRTVLTEVPESNSHSNSHSSTSNSSSQSTSSANATTSVTNQAENTAVPHQPISSKEGVINGHEWVDLGLPSGILWATCNVGAVKPSDIGGYFAWGETSVKQSYTSDNYKFFVRKGSKSYIYSKYVLESKNGKVDNKWILDPSDDAAKMNWGASWRMPTTKDWKELKQYCVWTWTNEKGVSGYRIRGKINTDKSIFLPIGGVKTDIQLTSPDENGIYWSSNIPLDCPANAACCGFDSMYILPDANIVRFPGAPVRPVSPKIKK